MIFPLIPKGVDRGKVFVVKKGEFYTVFPHFVEMTKIKHDIIPKRMGKTFVIYAFLFPLYNI